MLLRIVGNLDGRTDHEDRAALLTYPFNLRARLPSAPVVEMRDALELLLTRSPTWMAEFGLDPESDLDRAKAIEAIGADDIVFTPFAEAEGTLAGISIDQFGLKKVDVGGDAANFFAGPRSAFLKLIRDATREVSERQAVREFERFHSAVITEMANRVGTYPFDTFDQMGTPLRTVENLRRPGNDRFEVVWRISCNPSL